MINLNKSFEWNEHNKDKVGLPRPRYNVSPDYIKKFNKNLKQRIPVPWQSKPLFNEKGVAFNVIQENEKHVVSGNACGYCASSFLELEQCIRWKGDNLNEIPINSEDGPRVFSDINPLHFKCMKQARFFCPYLNKRPEEEFEYGTYKELKNNFLKYINNTQ